MPLGSFDGLLGRFTTKFQNVGVYKPERLSLSVKAVPG